ncbi:hypothetical protein CN429_15415, partial [Bacillus cereus]
TFHYFPVNFIRCWFIFVMPFLNKLTFDNFKLCYFSVDILPQVLITCILYRLSRVYMELIGSLTRDIRSLCVVIHLPVQEKLEHKFKNAVVFEYW